MIIWHDKLMMQNYFYGYRKSRHTVLSNIKLLSFSDISENCFKIGCFVKKSASQTCQ